VTTHPKRKRKRNRQNETEEQKNKLFWHTIVANATGVGSSGVQEELKSD
jgi:hypothetical protein